jgi:hypothetical protein
MLVSEAKTLLKRYGFSDEDPLLSWINAGRHELLDSHDWSWSRAVLLGQSLGVGDTEVILPSDASTLETVSVKATGVNQKLAPTSYQSFVANYDPVITGAPSVYAQYSDNKHVIVWPTPDQAYTLDFSYYKGYDDLTADTDDLGVPGSIAYAVVLAAAYTALQAENEEDRAATAQSQFQSRVAAAFVKDSRITGGGDDDGDQVEDVMNYSWR